MEDLFELYPRDRLKFRISSTGISKCELTLRNLSNEPLVYKVKTTEPHWYVVKPNQSIIKPNQLEKIQITLIDKQCARLYNMYENGKSQSLKDHRFQIQCRIASDTFYNKMKDLSPQEKPEEYTVYWKDSTNLAKKKLKVDYVYIDDLYNGDLTGGDGLRDNNNNNNDDDDIKRDNEELKRMISTSAHAEAIRKKIITDIKALEATKASLNQVLPQTLQDIQKRINEIDTNSAEIESWEIQLHSQKEHLASRMETLRKDLASLNRVAEENNNALKPTDNQDKNNQGMKEREYKSVATIPSQFSLITVAIILVVSYLIGRMVPQLIF